ncbi:MAG: hypothetical protein GY720_06340 [bacterium]|nr:hypothetical protein [bacterium]
MLTFLSRPTKGAMFALAVVLVYPATAASAQDVSACAEKFPEQDWEHVIDQDGIATYQAALTQEIGERFAETARKTAALIRNDIGQFPDMTLCVFGGATTLDAEGLLPPGQRLHAATFAGDAVVVVDSQQTRLVDDAIVFGMAHVGLWHLAAANGTVGYPEPLAGAIQQWYVSRVSEKLDQHHSVMRVANFFNDPDGNAPPTDWFVSAQVPIVAWNPEYQESPIGDFVDDAVARNGIGLLQTPDSADWTAAELTWRAALREELLQGADESNEWIGGALLAAGAVLGAFGLALWTRRQNRRKQEPIGEIATAEGFFDS